jgi:hypothetical protein
MEWKHPTLPVKEMLITPPLAGTVTPTPFWDAQVSILEHYQARGTAVNSML